MALLQPASKALLVICFYCLFDHFDHLHCGDLILSLHRVVRCFLSIIPSWFHLFCWFLLDSRLPVVSCVFCRTFVACYPFISSCFFLVSGYLGYSFVAVSCCRWVYLVSFWSSTVLESAVVVSCFLVAMCRLLGVASVEVVCSGIADLSRVLDVSMSKRWK
jgi:hypothetical protein